MAQRNFVENIVRETFETYGYAQVQTPLFESFALLSAQSGEEIRHKMFTFVGSDRIDYALRPELTAPCLQTHCEWGPKTPSLSI